MSHPFQEGGGGIVMSFPFLGEGDPLADSWGGATTVDRH